MDADTVIGGPGTDVLIGWGGDDSLRSKDGVSGNDQVFGNGGTDTCAIDGGDPTKGCETVTT
jgi:Ca2+-binding RTX toxin-like protein